MEMNVLIIGNDLNIQQLLVDILEITFEDIVIERVHTTESLLQKLMEQGKKYNLVIINSTSSKEADEALLKLLKIDYPAFTDRVLFLFSATDEKPKESLLKDIAYLTRPFSLDEIGAIMKRICLPAEVTNGRK